MKKLPDNQIAFYQSPDGSMNIEVLYAEENIWLNQKKIPVSTRLGIGVAYNKETFVPAGLTEVKRPCFFKSSGTSVVIEPETLDSHRWTQVSI